MAEEHSTRLRARQGRRFGVTVGLAFLALGALMLWRGRETGAWIALGLAGSLLGAALVAPTVLLPVEKVWMRMALAISRVTTPVFMAVVYFVVLTPIGILMRLLGHRTVFRRREGDSYWLAREKDAGHGSDMERQF